MEVAASVAPGSGLGASLNRGVTIPLIRNTIRIVIRGHDIYREYKKCSKLSVACVGSVINYPMLYRDLLFMLLFYFPLPL